MELTKIISKTEQNEISEFYSILTTIISESSECITLEKNTDAEDFVKTFNIADIKESYLILMGIKLQSSLILDIATDIFLRDGNSIISRGWFKTLFEAEIELILKEADVVKDAIVNGSGELTISRIRDYNTYYECVQTAYYNDLERKDSPISSSDDKSFLLTLKNMLNLSNSEARAILLSAVPKEYINYSDIDSIINMVTDSGIAFYKTTEMNIYIPDEFIILLRQIKGIILAHKYQRRILKNMDDKTVNRIKKLHGITEKEKHLALEAIIRQGVDIEAILDTGMFEEGTSVHDKEVILQDLIENKMELYFETPGRTVDQKIDILFDYFHKSELDPNMGISKEGYSRLLDDLNIHVSDFSRQVMDTFQLEPTLELKSDILAHYNIKPKDVLYIFPISELRQMCNHLNISTRRKNIVTQIINHYIDIENYSLLAGNDITALKNNGINSKPEESVSKFE